MVLQNNTKESKKKYNYWISLHPILSCIYRLQTFEPLVEPLLPHDGEKILAEKVNDTQKQFSISICSRITFVRLELHRGASTNVARFDVSCTRFLFPRIKTNTTFRQLKSYTFFGGKPQNRSKTNQQLTRAAGMMLRRIIHGGNQI